MRFLNKFLFTDSLLLKLNFNLLFLSVITFFNVIGIFSIFNFGIFNFNFKSLNKLLLFLILFFDEIFFGSEKTFFSKSNLLLL